MFKIELFSIFLFSVWKPVRGHLVQSWFDNGRGLDIGAFIRWNKLLGHLDERGSVVPSNLRSQDSTGTSVWSRGRHSRLRDLIFFTSRVFGLKPFSHCPLTDLGIAKYSSVTYSLVMPFGHIPRQIIAWWFLHNSPVGQGIFSIGYRMLLSRIGSPTNATKNRNDE